MTYHSTPGHVTDEEVDYVRAHLKMLLGDIRFLTLARTTSGTSLIDWGGAGANFTATEAVSNWLGHTTRGYHYALNGTDEYAYRADDANFTFGNGTTDSTFSVFALFQHTAHSSDYSLMSKLDIKSGGYAEWKLGFVSGKPTFATYDETNAVYVGRQYNGTLTDNIWYSLVGTYDGSAATTGFDLYINGVVQDDADYTAGSYTAMHDTTTAIGFGCCVNAATYGQLFPGLVTCVGVVAKELTSNDVYVLNRIMKAFWGVSI